MANSFNAPLRVGPRNGTNVKCKELEVVLREKQKIFPLVLPRSPCRAECTSKYTGRGSVIDGTIDEWPGPFFCVEFRGPS